MSVRVSLWGAAGSTPLTLAAVPNVGDVVVIGNTGYPVLQIAYANNEVVYAKVGDGSPFGGAPPAPQEQ